MDEDGKGRFFFGLFQYDWEKENNIEGIAILNPNGKWEHHHVKNSGMPYDHSNGIVYDRKEKILWISTEKSGLVRYDLNGNWEHYHSDNSSLPTSAIRDITRDSKGNIYLGTQNGTAKISRK
ncbi:MAG TPA: two-component regulator propeller domain-containing protein, partial [Flavobacterium sp.]|nr:two-component regulator propeller domain-containing protein [Flavobacterium sp.]